MIVQPPDGDYLPNTTYTLYISEEVYSKNKKQLQSPVKMDFTTGTERDQEKAFVPRSESSNSVELKEGIISLPEEILAVLLTPAYEENSFTFRGAPEELKDITERGHHCPTPNKYIPIWMVKGSC